MAWALSALDAPGRLVVTDLAGKTIVFYESGEPLARYGDPTSRITAPGFGMGASFRPTRSPGSSASSTHSLQSGGSLFPACLPLVAFVGANGIGVAVTWNTSSRSGTSQLAGISGKPFNRSDATVISSVVDASGRHLVSGGSDTVVWELDPAMWRVRACEAAGRNLTQEEWEEPLPEGEAYRRVRPRYVPGA